MITIIYKDGSTDTVGSMIRLEIEARKENERGAYLRKILRGARARVGAVTFSKWDGPKCASVAATEGGAR